MNEETLLQEALARSPEERAAFLELTCEGRPELRTAVEALLAAHDKPSNVLDKPPADLGQTVDSAPSDARGPATGPYIPADHAEPPPVNAPRIGGDANLGTVIAGRYTLVAIIGEGGMGSVYLAEQTLPVKRQVALKLIKAGMDTKAVLARFDAERQALAMMDHPNIARVYDGGTTPSGHPFFVMELVQGTPITR